METLNNFFEFEILSIGNYKLRVFALFAVLLTFLITKLILWLIKKAIFRKQVQKKIDIGNTYAIYQIIKYVIWIVAISLLLEAIGVKVTVLLAGSAALLVGVGLGLQQTFNDVISGFILLSERSIKVNDILEIDGDIVKIQNIGLRTSKGLNRDEISIIIPNSLITTNKVINWSHQSKKTRFRIKLGVAYGSDVKLVIKILEESAKAHADISQNDLVEARFSDFGNSSLDFELLFYSKNIFVIEKIKSDIRQIIIRKLKENNITVPFPQLDVYLKK